MTPLITAMPAVTAIWAATAAQTYSLAARRSRMRVRRTALRARATLLTGTAVTLTVALITVLSGAIVSAPRALAALPLLVLPVAVAAWRTLPALGRLADTLRTDPWGPSDPGIRRAAAGPELTVPPFAAFACTLLVPVALGGWVAALVAYALAGTATAALAWRAPHRREAATRAGLLRRVVRAATPAPAAGRKAA
jgi:hypothetical protein